jgi:hypothetical protein
VLLFGDRLEGWGIRNKGDDSMHDFSTRAGNISRQGSAIFASALAAFVFMAASSTSVATAASGNTGTAIETPAAQRKTAHDIAIEIVKPGKEGLELTARLSESGGLIERDIAWKILDAQSAVVYDGIAPIADVPVPPGDYTIETTYGSAHFSQSLTLLQANHLMVSFVLDVGGIRILPRVKNIGLPAIETQSLVYAASGHNKGKLITISRMPGEILRVEAGDYRIESRFSTGNAVAVADVHVKAGIMSAVEIDHAAGLARLAYVGAPTTPVSWLVTDAKGVALPAIGGLSANIVLKPGTYVAKANIGSESLTANFEITAGQARDILLGN